MTKQQRLQIRRANAANARAAKAAKRATVPTNGHFTLQLEPTEGRFLHDVLERVDHEAAARIRRQLLDQAFTR